ncbi:hypothetical protein Dsin_025171 [Dipteronia sinensis]|uniref:CUE domain-containing protein n=1 Tax=Dipteronia sinensis TaxID=43782 RepID=A0AAE0DWV2_9ROSI|nr:hypothetical protein Dsin_025171 [Dipteronia sinensis]
MGFNSVYRFLMEIFPQIDSRLLKAVAIEHSKDADAAANVVLTEILPFWSDRPVTSASLPEDQSSSASLPVDQSSSSLVPKEQSPGGLADEDLGAENEELSALSRRKRLSKKLDVGSALEPESVASCHAAESELICNHNSDSARAFNTLNKALDMSTVSHFYDANDGNSRLSESFESEELILLGKTQECSNVVGSKKLVEESISTNGDSDADLNQLIANTECNGSVSLDKDEDINVIVGPEQNTLVMSTTLIPENGVVNGNLTDVNVPLSFDLLESPLNELSRQGISCFDCSPVDVNVPLSFDLLDSPLNELSRQGISCFDCSLVKVDPVQENITDSLECVQAESSSGTPIVDCEIPDASVSPCLKSKQENPTNEEGHVDNESTNDAVISRSGQICKMDLLEEVIEDAKNNKKTLFLAMESIMNLMGEVELQEKAAEESEAEATRGGLDILLKAEELKQMLAHAKQINDMHGGEVYGEKAILATEVRELQTRLLCLSEERDKSLAVLDQMRVTLEARLATAEEARKAAEQEKLEKEESARSFLAEQEAIMEKVVQESKFLQQEADENSKLREFLMDRGHVVDSLQGEISVICQDVRLLKEKFDERVPLSQSVSSSQTTCILASSGSSLKSIASLVAEQVLASETPEESPTPVLVQSPKSRHEDVTSGADRRELMDDGWEIFDNDTELYSSAM